jgi:hypothetical protein
MIVRPPRLPNPRGPLSQLLIEALHGPPRSIGGAPIGAIDPRTDDDLQLTLHVAYELHYRSFDGVADEWEWHPDLISFTAQLEREFETALRADLVSVPGEEIRIELPRVIAAHDGPSLSSYVRDRGTLQQVREFAIHRSAYQLKEADPHTWAIPRLREDAKAALVRIQADEYGEGNPRHAHSALFADTMTALGLDPTYGAYVDRLPGVTLATGNLITMLGLHRRLRGALVGHLSAFEMTSVVPMSRYSRALRRLGIGRPGRRFYDVHVDADAMHEQIALHDLAGAFVRQEPQQAGEVLFGARALMDVEARFAGHLLSCWATDQSSLLGTDDDSALADIA